MLNLNNYLSVQASVMGNLGKYMPIIMQFKSFIQRAVIPLLSANELQDCYLNRQVIDKLVYIGIGQYKKTQSKVMKSFIAYVWL